LTALGHSTAARPRANNSFSDGNRSLVLQLIDLNASVMRYLPMYFFAISYYNATIFIFITALLYRCQRTKMVRHFCCKLLRLSLLANDAHIFLILRSMILAEHAYHSNDFDRDPFMVKHHPVLLYLCQKSHNGPAFLCKLSRLSLVANGAIRYILSNT
jgi:hypothetical protein